MSSEVTKITNIVEPSVFMPYMLERTNTLSELIQAGIVVRDPKMDILASTGGRTVNMPYWNDLTGNSQNLSDSASLTTNKITAAKDVARILYRGNAWAANELAAAVAGDDPMKAIADLVAAWWVRDEQTTLLSLLKGVFASNASANSSDLIHTAAAEATADIKSYSDASPTVMNPIAIIDARQKLGDAAHKFTALIMHSKCYTDLLKQNLIDFQKPSEQSTMLPYYLGYRIIVDDGCPTRSGTGAGTPTVYRSFLFAQGAIARGEGKPNTPVETDRDSLAGEDILITRRHFILHPRGIKWNEATVTDNISPSNSDLETLGNWTRVYEKKSIRIVLLETN